MHVCVPDGIKFGVSRLVDSSDHEDGPDGESEASNNNNSRTTPISNNNNNPSTINHNEKHHLHSIGALDADRDRGRSTGSVSPHRSPCTSPELEVRRVTSCLQDTDKTT